MTASQGFRHAASRGDAASAEPRESGEFWDRLRYSAFSLSENIGVTVAEAKHYIENYLNKYSGVRDYMKRIVEQAKEDGYVATLFHRRRYLPELKSSNYNIRSFGERVALNMPIQGTAADIIKRAMVNVSAGSRRKDCRQS